MLLKFDIIKGIWFIHNNQVYSVKFFSVYDQLLTDAMANQKTSQRPAEFSQAPNILLLTTLTCFVYGESPYQGGKS